MSVLVTWLLFYSGDIKDINLTCIKLKNMTLFVNIYVPE